jgi:RHS repeat-associated protein
VGARFGPYSGAALHQSAVAAGVHQHYFYGATQTLQISNTTPEERLYTYVYLDPANLPNEIMLQWNENGSWEHRAYWGANNIPWGTDGTASRRYMGPLPATEGWVKLEVASSAVGLLGKTINGMAFTLHGGMAYWDKAGKATPTGEVVWFDDVVPEGATAVADGGDSWTWVAGTYSGTAYHQSNLASGVHQHYFSGATQTLQINAGDRLYTYIYLDPANPPSEVMLQFAASGESGYPHRAYWGANLIPFGTDGTESRRYMGPLPPAGQWVRLEVPASVIGLEGKVLNGIAFTLYGGRASWDKVGKVRLVNNGTINGRLYTVDTAKNRLTSVDGMAMSYDAAGNQINDGSGQRTYDGENRLVEAYIGPVLVGSYVYDADGRRVRRIIGGQETWQVYGMGGELLAEYAAGAAPSAVQKEYGYRNGQLLVVWDGSETEERKWQWLVQDHLGSTRMVVDSSGSLGGVRRDDFLPFGERLGNGVGIRSASIGYSDNSVRQKFTGKERDETGLDYFGARYFSSTQGRFTSPDWSETPDPVPYADLSDPQSLNLYAYVRNNPLYYSDPDGHSIQDWLEKLKNGLSGNGFKTDKEIEQERRAAEIKHRQEAARAHKWLLDQGADPQKLSHLSNQQVIDVYNAAQRGETSVTSGGQTIELTYGIAGSSVGAKPLQEHHFATNKHRAYTPQMERIAKRYGLDLDGAWNKEMLPHAGRHTHTSHEFVLRGMQRAAREAGNDKAKFLKLFEKYVKEPIRRDPSILYK